MKIYDIYFALRKDGSMGNFNLVSEYAMGDQPEAIEQLIKGFQEGNQFQILLVLRVQRHLRWLIL